MIERFGLGHNNPEVAYELGTACIFGILVAEYLYIAGNLTVVSTAPQITPGKYRLVFAGETSWIVVDLVMQTATSVKLPNSFRFIRNSSSIVSRIRR